MYAIVHDGHGGSPDDGLAFRVIPPTLGQIELDLRECGYNRVRLNPVHGMAGWVSDVGLALRERFSRNTHGSAILVALGAPMQPYGGPVIITGYEYPKPGEEEMGYPEPLDEEQHDELVKLSHWIDVALRGEGPTADDAWPDDGADPLDWAARMRLFTDQVRDAPTPPITFSPGLIRFGPGGAE